MTTATEGTITAILAADSTVSADVANEALRVLRGEARNTPAPVADSVLTAREAAEVLNISTVTLRLWARQGLVKRITPKGRENAIGYSRLSVENLIAGRA